MQLTLTRESKPVLPAPLSLHLFTEKVKFYHVQAVQQVTQRPCEVGLRNVAGPIRGYRCE